MPEVQCENTCERQDMSVWISLSEPSTFSIRGGGAVAFLVAVVVGAFFGYIVKILWKHSSLWMENAIFPESTGGGWGGERSLLHFLNLSVKQEEKWPRKKAFIFHQNNIYAKIPIQAVNTRLKHIPLQSSAATIFIWTPLVFFWGWTEDQQL